LDSPRQATLVALYGPKPPAFEQLIARCGQAIGRSFSPCGIDQIHATIVGLERTSALDNLNFHRHRNQTAAMDLPGFLNHLRNSPLLPFRVQIGGFADRDYPFSSRGSRPYRRSFSIQGDKAVVMGWPIQDRLYPDTLHTLRQAAQPYNILHAYHRDPSDFDNDFYFRIGFVDRTAPGPEQDVREILAGADPVILEVTASDLCVASYIDDALPRESTIAWPIDDARLSDASLLYAQERDSR
jgi:hypothetical protein